MRPFEYVRAADVDGAVTAMAATSAQTRFIAGGTNLLDLMKEDVARPERLVDITRLPLAKLEARPDGGLRLGALATNADTAYDDQVAKRYPLIAKAILAGASAQIRNMATNGGNLLQRTRCHYFYDVATPCNKRAPGSGCSAIGGENRQHAILGASSECIAVHPSDLCVALAALDAVVQVRGPEGERSIPLTEFHRLPDEDPSKDTTLAPDELILAIDLSARAAAFAAHAAYLKVRDRQSYAFAVVSVAAAYELSADGTIKEARLALGGVAHKPWRRPEAEALLGGQKPEPSAFERAAAKLLEGAVGQGKNDFKITLAQRAIVRALEEAA